MRSLKAVLLRSGIKPPSVPVAYSALLKHIDYDSYTRRVVADLKVVAVHAGQKAGNAKRSCLPREWDTTSRVADKYARNLWPQRVQYYLTYAASPMAPSCRGEYSFTAVAHQARPLGSIIKTLAKRDDTPGRLATHH